MNPAKEEVWLAPGGVCMLIQIPTVHEEDVNEKTGKIEGHAAVGPKS